MSDILVVKSLFLMCDVSVVYCYTKSEKIDLRSNLSKQVADQ